MTQNPFQPWKQNLNLTNQFYRKNDTNLSAFNKVKNGDAGLSAMTHQYDIRSDMQSYAGPCTSSNLAPNAEELPAGKSSNQTAAKFSVFSQLLNLNKINAFDNLLRNSTMILDDDDLNSEKRQGIKKIMEQAISDDVKQQIAFILEKISVLRPAEKLFLYLKMPGGHSEVDPLKQSQNPLGTRSEISHTINWVKSHLEHDEKVSIPKQEVYEDYLSFCGKINIKALSTADFGKVMKQVFPDIRPRRLGTRGHSRYCYAAMRKATKLIEPDLPELKNASEVGSNNDDSAWKVIKSWSEGLLNTQFESVDKLAAYISENQLKPTSNSKQLLQKKIMQRDLRERRSNANLSNKKRKKKKHDSEDQDEEHDKMFNVQIKQEIEERKYSEDSSDVPMNLTSTKQPQRLQNESSNEGQTLFAADHEPSTNISKMQTNLCDTLGSNGLNQEDDNQYVFCKKVRQAQQLKMTANAANAIANPFQESSMTNQDLSHSETPHEMLMPSKIPSKRKQKREVNAQIKKMRYLGVQSEALSNLVEANDDVKNGDLKEEFILPRERFISICNMDRNALDHYLNANEENSQDLELLQYFDDDKNRKVDCIEEDLVPAPTSVPVLENYQLYNEGRNVDKAADKISQLRSMLEEKHSAASSLSGGGESVIKNLLQKPCHLASTDIGGSNLTPVDANGSQANFYNNMPSRPYQETAQQIRQFDQMEMSGCEKQIPQSPNTRRKNFSFVPIPAQSVRAKNINLHPVFKNDAQMSQFVSPRVSTMGRRAFFNTRGSQEAIDSSKSVPVIGINSNTAFCRPNIFKMEPADDRHQQSPSTRAEYAYSQQKQQELNEFQFQPSNQQSANYNYPLESRSQSVPPHSTHTSIYNSHNSYSSACSSMAATPVPPDYQEFSESNILDIFNNEQAEPTPSIKLEQLLDQGIMDQNVAESQTIRQTFLNSRSVPNTPLPYQNNYGNMNSFCPIGKSVPTTPIMGNMTFRYSPELQRTRDFLINGFNNNNNSSNISHNDQKVLRESLTSNDMDDLSNLDTSLLNNL